jgi:pantoate--beta-alanine ligase
MMVSNFPISRTPSAVFVPSVSEIYPSGIVQDIEEQKGTFVEVKGYSHQMEGKSRPTFFRGVATVVTKLFNIIQPTKAYFGQKDIQQALLLKHLCRDLLFSHPEPDNLRIIPTSRDPSDNLALSSRNAYLTSDGRKFAPILIQALRVAESAWTQGLTKAACIARAKTFVENNKAQAQSENSNINIDLEYLEMNDADSFEVVDSNSRESDVDLVILSGALNVDRTRLIDNILLGAKERILG